MGKRGPKGIPIDWNQFDKLCATQATLSDLARWFECSEDTIERAVKREKNCKFADYFEQKRGKGLISLRAKQFSMAMDGNVTLLIWLGKNYLGQCDRTQVSSESNAVVTIKDDELSKLKAANEARIDAIKQRK